MADEWRRAAKCRTYPAWVFYPDDSNPTAALLAKSICASCPVQRPCIRFSVRNREKFGIWGGLNPRRRRRLIRLWHDGDTAGYAKAVDQAILWVHAVAAGLTADDEVTPAHPCPRCGEPVDARRLPVDRTSPGATCGRASTYNDGCRCRPCIAAKMSYRRARGKIAVPPVTETDRRPSMSATDTADPEVEAETKVVPIGGKKPTAKKAAKKATARAKKTTTMETPVPLAEFYTDQGLDWALIEQQGITIDYEQWARLGDNTVRAAVAGPAWAADWWNWGRGHFTEDEVNQVIDPMRVGVKTLSNWAWAYGRLPHDIRKLTSVEHSLHVLAANLDTVVQRAEALEIAERDNLSWREMDKLVKTLQGKNDPTPDDDDDVPEPSAKTHKTVSLSVTVHQSDARLADALGEALEDYASKWLAERGIEPTKVTRSES